MPSYFWRAHYGDDDHLDETTPGDCLNGPHDGEHGWSCVDQSRLTGLEWVGPVGAYVHIEPNHRGILFRRNIIEDALGVLGEPVRSVIHVIGWQCTDTDGRNVQSLTAIFPDGSVRMVDSADDLVWRSP